MNLNEPKKLCNQPIGTVVSDHQLCPISPASPSLPGKLTTNLTTNQSHSNASHKSSTGHEAAGAGATQTAGYHINNLSDNNVATPAASVPIKKKSSSFLHRDYNRKPILARSQVSTYKYRVCKGVVVVILSVFFWCF